MGEMICAILFNQHFATFYSKTKWICNFKSGPETRPLRRIKRGQSDAVFYRISKSLAEWFRTQYKNVWEAKHN